MLKKLLFVLPACAYFTFAHAETCPTPTEIHNHQLQGWNAFDIDNGTPLSKEQIDTFTHNVKQFALAEWMDGAPEGPSHCYYDAPNYLGVFLAKKGLIPDKTFHGWAPVGSDTLQCRAGVNECRFVEE